jgi:hypothetical protein
MGNIFKRPDGNFTSEIEKKKKLPRTSSQSKVCFSKWKSKCSKSTTKKPVVQHKERFHRKAQC